MRNKGFSLIELSVALVIIAVIIAALLISNNLTQQAALQGIITELQKYKKAANQFKTIYYQYPGDFSTASTYWTGTTCTNLTASFCNGNGNGYIDTIASSSSDERTRAWKHLDLADLVDSSFSVIPNSYNATSWAIDTELPRSKVTKNNAVYVLAGAISPFSQDNAVYLSGHDYYYVTGYSNYGNAVLTSMEAFSIDMKIDDACYDASNNATGATTGNFRAMYGIPVFLGLYASPTCVTGIYYDLSITTTAIYTRPSCQIGLKL